MPLLKLALWWDPNWLPSLRRSWRRRKFWFTRGARTMTVGQYTLGPLRVEINLAGVDPAQARKAAEVEARTLARLRRLRRKHGR